jgi:hypothetical protein
MYKNKDRRLETARKWRAANKERLREWWKQYRLKNPKKQSEISRKWGQIYRREFRQFVDFAKSKPCHDCGIQYAPWIMQFDHRNPKEKSFTIASAVRAKIKRGIVEEEIKKCDVVCANCHAERTHRQWEAGKL